MSVREFVSRIGKGLQDTSDAKQVARDMSNDRMSNELKNTRIAGPSELEMQIGRNIQEPYNEITKDLLLRTEGHIPPTLLSLRCETDSSRISAP